MLDLTGYKLTFDEEFNTRSISQGAGTTWSNIREEWRIDGSSDLGFGRSSFLDPSSGYDPFAVNGGALTITAVPDHTASGAPGAWESGLIHTKNTFSQTYGYFEVRADLSNTFGAWDAFWMLPVQQTPPQANGGWKELDIVEHYGENDAGAYRWIHTTEGAALQSTTAHQAQTSGYHTYGMNWQPDRIEFYFDGELAGSQKTPADMNEPMYMLFNLAVDKASSASSMESKVDYIRAYSNDPNATAVALDAISSPDGVDTSHLYRAQAANTAADVQPGPVVASPAENDQASAPPPPTTNAQTPPAQTEHVGATPGSGDLKIQVSGDHYNGAPQFQVFVDGQQVGDIYTVTADHKAGEYQTFAIDAGLSAGPHDVEVRFLNDAWDGVNDRNLYIASIEANGQSYKGVQAVDFDPWNAVPDGVEPGSAVLWSAAGLHFATEAAAAQATPAAPNAPTPALAAEPVATQGDLTLKVSGDHYDGAPQFQVYVDGQQVGETYTVDARHSAGEYQTFVVDAGLTSDAHDVEVRFINDAWDGVNDRNLYVASIEANGRVIAGTQAEAFDPWNSVPGDAEPGTAVMWSAQGLHYTMDASRGEPVAETPAPAAQAPAPAPQAPKPDITLTLSGDEFDGRPEFQLFVDGEQIGDTYTVTADHASGAYEKFHFDANLRPGAHDVEVRFINDAWDGVHDRNLYIASIDVDGQTMNGTDSSNFDPWNTVPGGSESGSAVLWSASGFHFQTSGSGASAHADHDQSSHAAQPLLGSSLIWI